MQNVWIVTLHTGRDRNLRQEHKNLAKSFDALKVFGALEFHFLIEELEVNHGGFQMYFKTSVGQFEVLLLILMQQLPN